MVGSTKKKRPSGKVRHIHLGAGASGKTEILNRLQIARRKNLEAALLGMRIDGMTPAQKRAVQDVGTEQSTFTNLEEVLHDTGRIVLEFTGADAEVNTVGEDFVTHITHEIQDETQKTKRRRDTRDRSNRVHLRTLNFTPQMEAMADAYLLWKSTHPTNSWEEVSFDKPMMGEGTMENDGTIPLRVVDTFTMYMGAIAALKSDAFGSVTCVRNGLMPAAPINPGVAITIRTLELFRRAHLRCPRLTIQAFVRSLCDIHGVPFRGYLQEQFMIAQDLYLHIRRIVHLRVQAALHRNTPNWRLKHFCFPCTNRLVGEPHLPIDILCTDDGNHSISRLRGVAPVQRDADGNKLPPVSNERLDKRVCEGADYILDRKKVDLWAKESLAAMNMDMNEKTSPCEPRWANMTNEFTAKMWGVFDETGIFLCLCRHSSVLVATDMVRTGEQSKYSLAVINHILEVFDDSTKVAKAYDVGCGFNETFARAFRVMSPAHAARIKRFLSIVGGFHGHAHKRLCQLLFLLYYIDDLGLSDLENCEKYFSKSNSLAICTRHATAFHRQQELNAYFEHTDTHDAYANVSKLLCTLYKRAIALCATEAELIELMRRLKLDPEASDEIFKRWLKEERAHLELLAEEPTEETEAMEYLKKVRSLIKLEARLQRQRNIWVAESTRGAAPDWNHQVAEDDEMQWEDTYTEQSSTTQRTETARRHTMETHAVVLRQVQDLEARMGIRVRWAPGCPEWEPTKRLVAMREYQRALDNLEGLVVSRIFEFTKMNMSGTGYKLRKHISKAIQVRSQTLRTALATYNQAAVKVTPHRPTLDWDQVVEYAFISEFDLLRDSRQDIRAKPWADRIGRAALDQYRRIRHARDEIKRLNVEIPRLVTGIEEEDYYLRLREYRIAKTDPPLAHAIKEFRLERARYDRTHMDRLEELSQLVGFSGSIQAGTSVEKAHRDCRRMAAKIGKARFSTLGQAAPALNVTIEQHILLVKMHQDCGKEVAMLCGGRGCAVPAIDVDIMMGEGEGEPLGEPVIPHFGKQRVRDIEVMTLEDNEGEEDASDLEEEEDIGLQTSVIVRIVSDQNN